MKKIFLIGLLFVMTTLCLPCIAKSNINTIPYNTKLLEYNGYKNIRPDNIKKLEVIKFTAGGVTSEMIKKEEDVIKIYNMLNKKYVGRKSNICTDDNTTVYVFTLKDKTKIDIEIEADSLVIKGDRYLLK